MSTAFTPGPWRVGAYGPNGCFTVGTKNGLMTAMVAHSINERGQEAQAIGDAQLIAAAPELLEALVELAEAGAEAWGEHRPCVKEARAAIAKATGAA